MHNVGETLTQNVCSIAKAELYVIHLKEFARFHRKSSILDADMGIEESVASKNVWLQHTIEKQRLL